MSSEAATPPESPPRRILPIVDPKTGNQVKPSQPESNGSKVGTAAVETPTSPPPPSQTLNGRRENVEQEIARAVEYIFGDNNLPYDFFYLSQADQSQGVPMSYILNNPMIKRLTNDPQLVQQALRQSWLVEVHPLETDPTGLKVARHVPLMPQLALVAQRTMERGIRKRLSRRSKTKGDESEKTVDDLMCQVCGTSFETTAGLRHHCQSRAHQEMVTCDLHVLQWNDGCWQPVLAEMVTTPSLHNGARVSVVTFNVLFDFYYQEEIFSAQRYSAVMDSLRDTNADVIGLQEVTPQFVEMLMTQPWVQRSYFVSEVSSVVVQPFGQVILSRIPLTSVQLYHMNKVKTALFGHMMIGGVDHAFCVCHLVSNFSAAADIHSLRQAHLDTIFWELSQRASCSFVIGDFNFGDEEGNYTLEPYADVWTQLRGNDAGYTYDVERNSLAKVTMKEDSLSRRYDRILVHSTTLRPLHIELFGTAMCSVRVPNGGGRNHTRSHNIHLSDHYGVLCVCMLDLGPPEEAHPSAPFPAPPVHPHSQLPPYPEPPAQAHAYNHSNRNNGYSTPNGYDAHAHAPYAAHNGYGPAPFPNYVPEMHPAPGYSPPYAEHPPLYPDPYQPYSQYPGYPQYQYPHYPQYQQFPPQDPYPEHDHYAGYHQHH
uniref:C2H2-type domain-containing protein n=1 Tax=Eutreptiella gymnastica TaxID=73025 RepID=A0A7S4GJQ2_9EUGL